MGNIPTIVAVIIAISVASERLVEIIKSCSPYLNTKLDDPKKEGKRAALVQLIAVAASICTALLCWPALARFVPGTWTTLPAILALGFLASGGSAFWNSIQTYLLKLKDIESAAAKTAQKALREGTPVEKPVKFKIVSCDVSLSRNLHQFQRATETVDMKDGKLRLTIPIVASKQKE